MNKKSTMLLILPALALTGCAKAITPEEAKTRAAEIKAHTVDTSEIHALTFSLSMKEEMSGKINGKTGSSKSDYEILIELSDEKNFYHTKSVQKGYSQEGEEAAKSTENTSEIWAYIKDGVFYTATYTKENENESRSYVTVEGIETVVSAAFSTALKGIVASAVTQASGAEYLSEFDNFTKEEPVDGAKYSVKFSSAGEGSLIINGSVEFKDYKYSGVNASGKGSVKYAWDKYLLSQVSAKISLAAKEGEGETETDGNAKIEVVEKLQYKAKASYPDLSKFEKK